MCLSLQTKYRKDNSGNIKVGYLQEVAGIGQKRYRGNNTSPNISFLHSFVNVMKVQK